LQKSRKLRGVSEVSPKKKTRVWKFNFLRVCVYACVFFSNLLGYFLIELEGTLLIFLVIFFFFFLISKMYISKTQKGAQHRYTGGTSQCKVNDVHHNVK
jgi:hypothetical protein